MELRERLSFKPRVQESAEYFLRANNRRQNFEAKNPDPGKNPLKIAYGAVLSVLDWREAWILSTDMMQEAGPAIVFDLSKDFRDTHLRNIAESILEEAKAA